jgi:hypothetical protein
MVLPPLQEYTYVCGDILTENKCSGPLIFRDPDYVTINMSDLVSSMSLQGAIRSKLRGRKLNRWLSYLSRYRIEVSPKEFSSILKLGSVITIYVDGIDVEGTSGDLVTKEIRVVGTGYNVDKIVEELTSLSPRLITVQIRQGVWYMVTSYSTTFIDPGLKKMLQSFVNTKRMECKKIEIKGNTRICYKD